MMLTQSSLIQAQETNQSSSKQQEQVQATASSSAYIPQFYTDLIQDEYVKLNTQRKGRKKMKSPFVDYADGSRISSFSLIHNLSIHTGALTSLDFDKGKGNILITCGDDKMIHAFNVELGKIEDSIKLKRNLTGCLFAGNIFTRDDKLSIVATDSKGGLYILSYNLDEHRFTEEHYEDLGEELTHLCLHPVSSLVLALKGTNNWILFDVKEVILLINRRNESYLKDIYMELLH